MALVCSPALHFSPYTLPLARFSSFKGRGTHQSCRCGTTTTTTGGRSRSRSGKGDEIEFFVSPTATCSYSSDPDAAPRDGRRGGISDSRSRGRNGEGEEVEFFASPTAFCTYSSDRDAVPRGGRRGGTRDSRSSSNRFSFVRNVFDDLRLGIEGGDSGVQRWNSSRPRLGRRLLLSLLMFGSAGGLPLPQLAPSFRDFTGATAAAVDADLPPSGVLEDDVPEKEVPEEQVTSDLFGFDGFGKPSEEYALGKVVALAQAGDGAVVFLGVDGFEAPLQLLVGPAEAMAVLTAVQERKSRRPVTHEAWGLSLAAVGWKVDRVVITGNEKDIFYSNVVLSNLSQLLMSTPDAKKSVDMRPSDGIALALRCRAPLFVRRKVAEDILGSKMDLGRKAKVDPLKQPGLQANSHDASVITFV